MAGDFKHNHYVPEWYQKRFLEPGKGKYWYLDLKPDVEVLPNGRKIPRRNLLNWGPGSCFAEDDLYTVKWGGTENVDIEKFFFGRVDREGKSAVEFFTTFRFDQRGQEEAFRALLNYMSCEIASNYDPSQYSRMSLITRTNPQLRWGHSWTRYSARGIVIFRNEIIALLDFEGGVNVGRNFTPCGKNRTVEERKLSAVGIRITVDEPL